MDLSRLVALQDNKICADRARNTFFTTSIFFLLVDKVLTSKNQMTLAIFITFLISCVHEVSKQVFSFNFFLDIQN